MKEQQGTTRRIAKEELRRYIEQTNAIRELSSPQIREIEGADNYRRELMRNFSHIGELARDNVRILEQYFFPSLQAGEDLGPDVVEDMYDFSAALIDAANLNNLDSPLVYYQAKRLLQEADAHGDDEAKILALDGVVMAAYLMIGLSTRLVPVSDIVMRYYHVGLSAAERLLEYLDHDKFLTLSDEMKKLVVINARYIRVVSEVDDIVDTPEERARNMRRMQDALALAEDPFYREQLPDYNWDLHIFRTYEYICSFTDVNNAKCYDEEQIRYINECSKKMKELCESGRIDIKNNHPTRLYRLFQIRNAYLAGETDIRQYKAELTSLILLDYREDLADSVPMVMLLAPLEYMQIIDRDNMSAEEVSTLSYFYNKLIGYMHQTPKKDHLTFQLTCLSLILKNFIELPGIMDMETMGLSLIAALHPTTYVHTLNVADFTKMLTRQLLQKQPELFVGGPGYDSVDKVRSREAEIEEYAYHASLCHDFGKLLIADTILTYGRDLLDEEFEFVRAHPSIGAHLLSKHPTTAAYADVALGHHKWFNDQGGYPSDFSMEKSPYRTVISIVACADCLDAATDSVGRSYKQGKSLDEFLEELHEGSGTRYAPYMDELLADPKVREKIEEMLTKGREENYRKTYFLLKKNSV